jgi:hypothetical protein
MIMRIGIPLYSSWPCHNITPDFDAKRTILPGEIYFGIKTKKKT